jgi:6-phosphogluconate dehydrogenase
MIKTLLWSPALIILSICPSSLYVCIVLQMNWNIDLGECARIWKGGCIIRAAFLGRIQDAYTRNPKLANLMVDPAFASELNRRQSSWRRIVTLW